MGVGRRWMGEGVVASILLKRRGPTRTSCEILVAARRMVLRVRSCVRAKRRKARRRRLQLAL